MRWRVRGRPFTAVAAGLLVVLAFGGGNAWARAHKNSGPGPVLLIVADRIVGFVPFTVSLYGKIVGAEPEHVELCRSQVRPPGEAMTAGHDGRGGGNAGRDVDPMTGPTRPGREAIGPACESGNLSRTAEGFDYAHELRFDRPGTYQVRLQMVDTQGKRTLSNTVQVNAH